MDRRELVDDGLDEDTEGDLDGLQVLGPGRSGVLARRDANVVEKRLLHPRNQDSSALLSHIFLDGGVPEAVVHHDAVAGVDCEQRRPVSDAGV